MFTKLTISIPVWLDRLCAWPVMWYRRRKFGYDFRRIDLGEGWWTILDAEDYYRLNDFKWSIGGTGNKFYAVRGTKTGTERAKIVSLHREIMKPPAGLLVDHRNGFSLDNRRENLRLATHSQNQFNKAKTCSKTSSRYIGVYFEKCSGLWVVQIKHRRKRIFLGRFDSEIDAARAYDAAAQRYRGEFARLNFPQDLAGACPPKL